MTIELSPEQQRVIDLAIQSGAYHSSDEVIATALSILAEDIEDGAVSEARANEPRSSLAEVETEFGSLCNAHRVGAHSLYLGDACELLADVPDESVDLIFADPPYNIGKVFNGTRDKWKSDEAYVSWAKKWLALCIQKLTPTGSMYVMTATQNMPYFDIYLRERIDVLSRIVWFYDSSGVQARRCFGSMYEPILLCVKDKDNYLFNADEIRVEAKTGAQRKLIDYRKAIPKPYNPTKVPGNVWEFPRVRYRMHEYENHPSQKPEALLERIIRASSNPGQLVLDPFAGTFTTCFVAQSLGRRSIGIELDPEYFKIGLRRLNLAKEYNGTPLIRQTKSTARRNWGGVKNALVETSGTLFE